MWAEKSDEATNAQQNAAPDTHVQNAILDIDAAKIRKDAEIAIGNDVKLRKLKAYHGATKLRVQIQNKIGMRTPYYDLSSCLFYTVLNKGLV